MGYSTKVEKNLKKRFDSSEGSLRPPLKPLSCPDRNRCYYCQADPVAQVFLWLQYNKVGSLTGCPRNHLEIRNKDFPQNCQEQNWVLQETGAVRELTLT